MLLSDFHFGWPNLDQPTETAIHRALSTASERSIDCFVDSGDAHHGALDLAKGEKARSAWTRVSGALGPNLPFLYLPGNHEMLDFRGEDAEWRCVVLGSLGLRPYWSMSFRGIHFAAVPQMRRVNLVNREVLEWLALDLDLHRHETTILLAHQALKGTTYNNGELDYRELVNSDEMFSLMDRHPQVKAWMHGHNHTFEVVKKHGRLYVSNGRMGGFIPPLEWGEFGQPHLGGMVLDISEDRILVRAYNGSLGRYFDGPRMQGEIIGPTTYNPAASTRFSMGLGLAAGGQHWPLNRHFSSTTPLRIVARRASDRALNDDPGLHLSCPLWGERAEKRRERGEQSNVLIHAQVDAPAHAWATDPPLGLRFAAHGATQTPVMLWVPGRLQQHLPYFRVAVGVGYRLLLALDSKQSVTVTVSLIIRDEAEDEPRVEPLRPRVWRPGDDPLQFDFSIEPERARHSAVLLGWSLQLVADDAEFSIGHSELYRLPDPGDRPLVVDLPGAGLVTLDATGFATVSRAAQAALESGTIQLSGGGSWPMAVLLQQDACDFQVRNAHVRDLGDALEIGPLSTPWATHQQICIARLTHDERPFVCATRHMERLLLKPFERGHAEISLEVLESSSEAPEIEIWAKFEPHVTGATLLRRNGERWIYGLSANRVTIHPERA
jgi:hypothetical protein